jgi:hypothetical protein
MPELRHVLALPRSRAGLAARLRALSAARLAVALLLGGGVHGAATDGREARQRMRPSVTLPGVAAV